MQFEKTQLREEAHVFGKYILGIKINNNSINRYIKSFELAPMKININEQKLINKAIKNKWKLPYFDAALSLRNPNHLLKQKLLRMFAVLETKPEYANYFLGRNFPNTYIFKIFFIGLRGVFRAIIGLIITPKIN